MFGAYAEDGTQVAFVRAVTDGATFAWLCDVVVDDAVRGQGIGTELVGAAVARLRAAGVRRVLLATRDAHGLYERFGFTPLDSPAMWMEARF